MPREMRRLSAAGKRWRRVCCLVVAAALLAMVPGSVYWWDNLHPLLGKAARSQVGVVSVCNKGSQEMGIIMLHSRTR